MKLSLEVIKGPETGRKFEFTQPGTFIVGRGGKDRPVHFKLSDDDPYVSRQHFLLEIAPPRTSGSGSEGMSHCDYREEVGNSVGNPVVIVVTRFSS